MRRHVTVLALLAAFAWAGTASAQEFAIGAHAGWAAPLDRYEADFGADAAGARSGFTLGVDALYPLDILTDQLGWYSSLSVIRNGTEGSQNRTGGLVDGGFTLVPLMTGLRFDLWTLPNLYITGQGGLVFVRGPSEFFPYGMDGDPSIGVHPGYSVGIGMQLTEMLNISAKYFPLGTVDFDYDDMDDPLQQEVEVLNVQIGVRLL